MSNAAPLILTAALDEGAFAWFDDLRRTHFPPHRNRVPAHLTLFHALPGDEEPAIAAWVKAACQRRAPMKLDVRGPWSIGRGVAYRLASAELDDFRQELVNAFRPWLTAQDQAPFRPHITIQNKVEPAAARHLLEHLQQEFEPFDIVAQGVQVWRYMGGPWEPVAEIAFGPA